MSNPCLLLAQPSFWAEMLEEWVKAIGPFMLSLQNRKCAGNCGLLGWRIGKAGSARYCLLKSSGQVILEQNISTPCSDGSLRLV